jgi:hypothetical protein
VVRFRDAFAAPSGASAGSSSSDRTVSSDLRTRATPVVPPNAAADRPACKSGGVSRARKRPRRAARRSESQGLLQRAGTKQRRIVATLDGQQELGKLRPPYRPSHNERGRPRRKAQARRCAAQGIQPAHTVGGSPAKGLRNGCPVLPALRRTHASACGDHGGRCCAADPRLPQPLPTRAPPLARSRPGDRTRAWPSHDAPGAAAADASWAAFEFDQSTPAEWDIGA